jgi:hypothetical protein
MMKVLLVVVLIGAHGCEWPGASRPLSALHLRYIRAESLMPMKDLPDNIREVLALDARSYVLIAAACGRYHCFVHYEQRGPAPEFHVVLLGLYEGEVRFEWSGVVPAALSGIAEVRSAVLRDAASSQWFSR